MGQEIRPGIRAGRGPSGEVVPSRAGGGCGAPNRGPAGADDLDDLDGRAGERRLDLAAVLPSTALTRLDRRPHLPHLGDCHDLVADDRLRGIAERGDVVGVAAADSS